MEPCSMTDHAARFEPQQSSDSRIPRRSGNCKLPELIDVPTYGQARHAEVLGFKCQHSATRLIDLLRLAVICVKNLSRVTGLAKSSEALFTGWLRWPGQLRVVTPLRKWDNCLLAKTWNILEWSDSILLDQCPLGQFLPLTVVAFAKLFAKTSQHSTGCSRLLTRLAVGKRALARSTCKISRRNLGFHVSPGAMIYQDIYHQQLKLLYVSIKSYLITCVHCEFCSPWTCWFNLICNIVIQRTAH